MGASHTLGWDDLGVLWSLATLPGAALLGARGATRDDGDYEVLEAARRDASIERRLYPARVVVSTQVRGVSFEESSAIAFRRLFDYANGANQRAHGASRRGAAGGVGEELSMGAPLLHRPLELGGFEVSFMLPSRYRVGTAPEPLDARLKVQLLPRRQVAAMRFSGAASERRFSKKINVLKRWMRGMGYLVDGAPTFAAYDPPYTLSPFRRNEVLITLGSLF